MILTVSSIQILLFWSIFFANWCGPCKTLSVITKEVKDTLGDRLKIVKINVDKNQQLVANYQVRGVPTLLLFKNGKQVWRNSGVHSKENLIRIIISNNP
jgi:thioredoxin 1